VVRLIRYAEKHATAERISVRKLAHNLRNMEADEPVGSEEFIERARRADRRYPIVVCRERGGSLTVLDGLHRLWKAKDKRARSIWARVITRKQLRSIPQG
jgi:hypothetical protein